mmetsp:Transcript_47408/g.133800  ORF Transcript_47408/g.133800 Transcript_47408/m.133800 type:complete len:413 (-) Transcript_47408:15-1253(-)
MPIPAEFTAEAVKAKSSGEGRIPYHGARESGEPLRSVLASNPWLRAPDHGRPPDCPLYDSGRGAEGGGMDGKSRYWDTTVGRKHNYWKQFSLPRATKDIKQMRRDVVEWGYCLIEDALSAEQCARARGRLEEQAEAERECGVADVTPSFQVVWALLNKGDCFVRCLDFSPEGVQGGPVMEQLNEELLGPAHCATSFGGNVVMPRNMPQRLHQSGPIHPIQTPEAPVLVNNIYILDDVNEDSGGTLVVPGSHKLVARAASEPVGALPPAINIEARAGTVMILDGRVLHGAGVNHTDRWRYAMTQANSKWWIRQQENWQLTASPEVLRSATPKLLRRLGFSTSGLLEVQQYSGMMANRDVRLLLDEGAYNRIGFLKGPVPQHERERLTVWRMKQKKLARKEAREEAQKGGVAKL